MKKLYEVRYELVTYVLAEDEKSARRVGTDALNEEVGNIDVWGADVTQVTNRNWPLDGGWDGSSLVAGADDDTRIDAVLATLPEDPQYKRLLELHHALEPGYHANKPAAEKLPPQKVMELFEEAAKQMNKKGKP